MSTLIDKMRMLIYNISINEFSHLFRSSADFGSTGTEPEQQASAVGECSDITPQCFLYHGGTHMSSIIPVICHNYLENQRKQSELPHNSDKKKNVPKAELTNEEKDILTNYLTIGDLRSFFEYSIQWIEQKVRENLNNETDKSAEKADKENQ